MKINVKVDLGKGPTETMCAHLNKTNHEITCRYLYYHVHYHAWYCELYNHKFKADFKVNCKRLKKCKEAKV